MADKVNIHCDGVVFNNSFGNKNKLDGGHLHSGTSSLAAGVGGAGASGIHHNSSQSTPSSSSSQHPVDRLKILYPNVNENETPLPRSWSSHDKCHAIGLSLNNLRVQYKGINPFSINFYLIIKNRKNNNLGKKKQRARK